ncbi:hypothetical protein MYX77_06465 [Acidobacteriia bacterium AH_259_A11_L15]|nr:hypothetical protein [Acidobacteriia bacterium AH_259_A11_L15]
MDNGNREPLEHAQTSGNGAAVRDGNGQQENASSRRIAAARTPARRAATGPRTRAGKQRSKYNSLRHGIFAAVVLEGQESVEDYQRLLAGLREDLRPVGTVEELWVEQLCMLLWRWRRLVIAEKAEILPKPKPIELSGPYESLRYTTRGVGDVVLGLLPFAKTPEMIQEAIDLLEEWREIVEAAGLDYDHGRQVLEEVYGTLAVSAARRGLPFAYMLIFGLMKGCPDHETGEPTVPKDKRISPEEAKTRLLKQIDEEIKRLGALRDELQELLEWDRNERETQEMNRRMVPPAAERLIKYEQMLSRGIEKTLLQLERLQRRRLGEKDLPPLKLDLSG